VSVAAAAAVGAAPAEDELADEREPPPAALELLADDVELAAPPTDEELEEEVELAGGWPATRTTIAWLPPFRKKSRTANPRDCPIARPPKVLSKSAKPSTVNGVSRGPRDVRPTNAAIEVATPVMVRTPLLTSCM
jgi:hypothetical protein